MTRPIRLNSFGWRYVSSSARFACIWPGGVWIFTVLWKSLRKVRPCRFQRSFLFVHFLLDQGLSLAIFTFADQKNTGASAISFDLIGFVGNYLLPFHAGKVMRAMSVGQTQSEQGRSPRVDRPGKGFRRIVISLTPLLVLAAVDLPSWIVHVNVAFLALYLAGLAALAVAPQRGWTEGWIARTTSYLPESLGRRIKSVSGEFLQGMESINRTGALMPVVLLSLACWLVHGLYFFFIFVALEIELSFWAALILQTIVGIGVILPAAPGYVGNFEYFAVLALALFGVPQEVAFAYALLAHVCQFVPVTVVGLFFALRSGFQSHVEAARTQAG